MWTDNLTEREDRMDRARPGQSSKGSQETFLQKVQDRDDLRESRMLVSQTFSWSLKTRLPIRCPHRNPDPTDPDPAKGSLIRTGTQPGSGTKQTATKIRKTNRLRSPVPASIKLLNDVKKWGNRATGQQTHEHSAILLPWFLFYVTTMFM